MSFSIPQQIEKDIICGKAVYRTFQTGNGGQSILQVPTNSYAVIYGYDFSPAGGGMFAEDTQNADPQLSSTKLRFFETQQISFFTGNDFFPFIHHVDNTIASLRIDSIGETRIIYSINSSPICRQVYITSTNDVAITHGLILTTQGFFAGNIPVTSRTPGFLTYGGAVQPIQAQTNYGPGATPQSFMQPSPKDFQDFGLGLLPPNPAEQAFATPDVTNGLLEANNHLQNIGGDAFVQAAAANYYLCIHYALYSAAIPEPRG